MGIQNDGAKAGKGLMIGVGAGVAVLVLVVVLFLVVGCGDGKGAGGAGEGGSAAAAAGTTLDPRLYLPEGAENGNFISLSMNMQKVLKLGVFASMLSNPQVLHDLQNGSPIEPKDVLEVLILVPMDKDGRPTILGVVKLVKDMPTSAMMKDGGFKGSVAGMETYFVSEEESKDMSSRSPTVTKLGSGMFLFAVEGMTHGDLAGYLAKAGKRTPAVFPAGVKALQDKVGGGDVVLFGAFDASAPPDVPSAFAGVVGSKIMAEATFRNEAAVGEMETQVKQALEQLGNAAPKVDMTHSGMTLSASTSADVLAAGSPLDKFVGESLVRAQELANRTSSAANLRGLAMSCVLWASDHQDMFPDHPAQLVVEEGMSQKLFASRRTQTTPADFSAAELEAGKKDWHAMAAKLEAHNDYLYFGAGLKNFTDSEIIVACEKPAGLKDGINVAYQDGHVDFVRLANVQQEFEANNKARADKKMKVISMSGGMPVGP